MEYTTNDGSVRWDRAGSILRDINDGYLSNIDRIEYRHESDVGPFKLQSGDDPDTDPDLLGSRLLKSISTLCGIISKLEHNHVPEEEGLYRLSKFAPITSKLSDQYAMEDRMYREQFHDDVLEICEAIMAASRNDTKSEGSE